MPEAGIRKFISDEGVELGSPAYRFDHVDSGTFGSTYRVIEKKSGVKIGLLKVFHPEQGNVEDRLTLEAEALNALRGADGHAPKLLAVGRCRDEERQEYPAILMEYIDGYTLMEALNKNVLTGGAIRLGMGHNALGAQKTLEVMRRVAQAVASCHAASLEKGIHRDLSPNNVMLVVRPDDDNSIDRAVLIDFGQAARWGIKTIGRLGTLWFSAPELFEGDFHSENKVSPRGVRWLKEVTMDVWSLGALAYYLRMGAVPFSTSDVNAVNYASFAKGHPISLVEGLGERSPENNPSELDRCLDRFIAICTSYDPHDRFQSAAEALGAIERILMDPESAQAYLDGFKKSEKDTDSTHVEDTVQTVVTTPPPKSARLAALGTSLLGTLEKKANKVVVIVPGVLVVLFGSPVVPFCMFLGYANDLFPIEVPPLVWVFLLALCDIEGGLFCGYNHAESRFGRILRLFGSVVLGALYGGCLLPGFIDGAGAERVGLVFFVASILLSFTSYLVSLYTTKRNEYFMQEMPQVLITLAASLAIALASVQVAGMAASSPTDEQVASDPLFDSWGPQDRETFTWEEPASYPTFNSITDNPTLGDERNFVRVREAGSDDAFTDEATLTAGKEYEVYVYYHNNASAHLNESGEGLAQDVRLSVLCPEHLEANHAAVVQVNLTSSADPSEIFDTAYLIAQDSDITLSYVSGSAVVHNEGSANGTALDDAALWSDEGAPLSYSAEYPGVIPGCAEYAGYVTFLMRAA